VLVVSDSSELNELTIWPAALRPRALESTQSAAAARTSLLMSTDGSETASSMSSCVYSTMQAPLTMSRVSCVNSAPVVGFAAPSATVPNVGRPAYSVYFSRLPLTRRMRRPGMPMMADCRLTPLLKKMPASASGTRKPPLAAVPSRSGMALAMTGSPGVAVRGAALRPITLGGSDAAYYGPGFTPRAGGTCC
jgi:hypothetical protein